MNTSANEIDEEQFSEIELYIEGTILVFICLLAVVGNTCMWIIICRTRELRTVTNYFILSLTVADLMVSIINMPVTVVTLFCGGKSPLSEDVCKLFGFLNMLTLVASVMSLCNISINRYIMVCKPIYFKRIYTHRNAAIMISVCFGTSFAISLPPLFGWARYSFIPIQSFCFCDWTTAPSYAFFMISTCFGIPFSVMTVCNILIFRTVRASKRRLAPQKVSTQMTERSNISTIYEGDENSFHHSTNDKKRLTNEGTQSRNKTLIFTKICVCKQRATEEPNIESQEDSVTPHSSNTTINENGKSSAGVGQTKRIRRGKARTEEIRLATSLAVIVVVFVICWLPYCCSMLLSMFGPKDVPRALHMFTLLIGYANSCCNPIIYGIMNKKFGDGFRRLLCCCRRKS